jgi:anti-sigma factor RsiW
MSECPYQSRLSAFHDHELDAETAEKLASHLSGCPTCHEQLQGIRAVSRLFREAPSGRMSRMGVARLHAVAERAAKRTDVFPFMKMMTAVAASILVIAGAWLIEMPGQTQTPAVIVDKGREAEWEKLARGNFTTPQTVNRDIGVASRTQFSDWMIKNLQRDSGS